MTVVSLLVLAAIIAVVVYLSWPAPEPIVRKEEPEPTFFELLFNNPVKFFQKPLNIAITVGSVVGLVVVIVLIVMAGRGVKKCTRPKIPQAVLDEIAAIARLYTQIEGKIEEPEDTNETWGRLNIEATGTITIVGTDITIPLLIHARSLAGCMKYLISLRHTLPANAQAHWPLILTYSQELVPVFSTSDLNVLLDSSGALTVNALYQPGESQSSC